MNAPAPRYSKEETARIGQKRYRQEVQPFVEAAHQGEFVAIDIESGDYALDKDDFTATEKLLASQPDAQIWLMRVGHPAARRMGRPRFGAKHSKD